MMRVALDTDVMVYAEGIGDRNRCTLAFRLLERLPAEFVLVPAQALGELFRVLTGKAQWDPNLAHKAIINWADSFEIADSTWTAFQAAIDLSIDHKMQIWDALILAVTAENRCRILLTEDLQDGFTWRGVTVVNPFSTSPSPLLENVITRS
jgi:predicted nucleic acid-binding protein